MPPLTPAQERTRERVETLIGVMAPALTLVLAVGDRLSHIVGPEDHEYYPVRHMSAEEVRDEKGRDEKGRDSDSGIAGGPESE